MPKVYLMMNTKTEPINLWAPVAVCGAFQYKIDARTQAAKPHESRATTVVVLGGISIK